MIAKPLALVEVPNQRLFSTRQAARYLGVSEDTLRKYADLGMIPVYKLERRRVFRLEDLDRFIEGLPPYTPDDYTHLGGKPGGKESEDGS